jgi:signal transduction histidine kinase
VIWEGRAIASINLGFPTWRGFSAAELAYMETIAGQCAQALQRARAYVAEHAARALAERNVDLRERMLAVVSHDLRSPLGTIVTIAAMVARAADHEVPRDVLAKWAGGLDRSAKQMTRLINDLLDLAMIDGGSFRIVRGDHALDEIVEDALATFRPVALERGIRLSASVPRNQVVDCDAARTVQVLGNLLSNALSVTPRGGEVRVECTVTLDHVRIEVRDTGPGIAPDDLPRLFDRYWRAASPHYRGAGLGLAIAKGIVEAQDGRISVTSVVGVGTAFAFTVSRER